jgi:mannitol-1-phosphate 5-dehydrogenase
VFRQPSFESLNALKKIDYPDGPDFSVKSKPVSGFSGSNSYKDLKTCQVFSEKTMTNTDRKQVLQFGAGNIGRGLIGILMSQAGYTVTFVDVVDPLIEAINERGQFTVREIDPTGTKETIVENIRAINAKAEAQVIEAFGQADLVTTAVGPGVLRVIAPGLAKGLQHRADLNLDTPLNVIACENLIDNSKILQSHVLDHLSSDYNAYVKKWVGFPCCVVDRVVIPAGKVEQETDPLLVIAEGQGQLVVDRAGFVGEPPVIPGMQLTDHLAAYVEQKIFTLNMAHAITAYLGYRQGYELIHAALEDPQIRQIVTGALAEVGAVLVKRHGLDPTEQEQYANRVLNRFENSALPDPVARVGREPKRKLAPTDRLVKPATLALEVGVTPSYLATGIAAALLYDAPDDPEAVELARALDEKGVDQVLVDVCGLPADHALVALVKVKVTEVRNLF